MRGQSITDRLFRYRTPSPPPFLTSPPNHTTTSLAHHRVCYRNLSSSLDTAHTTHHLRLLLTNDYCTPRPQWSQFAIGISCYRNLATVINNYRTRVASSSSTSSSPSSVLSLKSRFRMRTSVPPALNVSNCKTGHFPAS